MPIEGATIAMGVTVGWAASTDMYYGIYCLLMGGVFVIARVVYIEPSPHADVGELRQVLHLHFHDAIVVDIGRRVEGDAIGLGRMLSPLQR